MENFIKEINNEFVKIKHVIFQTAKKIYIQSEFPIRTKFHALGEKVYQVEFEHVQFSKVSDVVDKINDFIKKTCNNQTNIIIQNSNIDTDCKMVLVVANFVKFTFLTFNKKPIQKMFYTTSEKTQELEFVETDMILNYYDNSELRAKFVEVPSDEQKSSFVLVVPYDIDGLSDIEKQISTLFESIRYKEERVHLVLPKCKFDFMMDLSQVLQNLGLVKAFERDADFSQMIVEKTGCCLNRVFHVTTIYPFHESAVKKHTTAKRVTVTSRDFIADRPFLVFLKVKDIVLLTARLKEPS